MVPELLLALYIYQHKHLSNCTLHHVLFPILPLPCVCPLRIFVQIPWQYFLSNIGSIDLKTQLAGAAEKEDDAAFYPAKKAIALGGFGER